MEKFTFCIRTSRPLIAPEFVGDVPVAMEFRDQVSSTIVATSQELQEDGGVIYSAQRYADKEDMPRIQLGWLVDSAFILCSGDMITHQIQQNQPESQKETA